jgi:urea transport system ATP-binding protein
MSEQAFNVESIEDRTILYLDKVSVAFDGFHALTDLSLYVDVGELRCIIGPNGAGKTTMMDVITGKTRPDSGAVVFGDDVDLLKLREPEIARLGIESQTVLANLELAGARRKDVWPTLINRVSAEEQARIDEALVTIGLTQHANRLAGALSHGQKQWLEIGMLLMQDPSLLLVDEPVAGMTHQETEATAELLTSLAGERSIVVVEHDMEFVRSIAKRVTVLHEGQVLAEGLMDEIQRNQRVIEVYLGE